jgi:phage shock protein A
MTEHEKLDAIEAVLQLLSAQISNMRTELQAVKAYVEVIAEHLQVEMEVETKEKEQELEDARKYVEHHYEGGE